MIEAIDGRYHITVGKIFLVLTHEQFKSACALGKAIRRVQAQRAREAQMAEAVQTTREENR